MTVGPPQFELRGGSGRRLSGVEEGEGPAILLAHGLTAHRDLVVHGSRALIRAGYRTLRYDARGHGASEGTGADSYAYAPLAADLGRVLEQSLAEGERVVAVGHSMGAHTIVRRALDDPGRFAALVVIGPADTGSRLSEAELSYWEALADGIDSDGIDGFVAALDHGLQPRWREVILRVARERMGRHRDLAAIAQALREVPGDSPIESLSELSGIELPTLVVGSGDDADPGHPYETARRYADALPNAELISEGEGESPLAWQGGKLSRRIAAFCAGIGIPGRV